MNEVNQKKVEEEHFKRIGIHWVGMADGYFFDIEDKQDSEDEIIIRFNLAQNDNKGKLFSYFDELQGNGRIVEYGLDKKKISLLYRESDADSVYPLLEEIVAKLKEIGGKCVCDNCDCEETLSFYSDGRMHALLCDRCGLEAIQRCEQSRNKENHYVKGFFASLIGALIGSIAWIIIGVLGFFASIAGVAISYCAFKGYSFVDGKLTRKGIILNVITILIAFLFAQYAVLFIAFLKEYPYITLLDFIRVTPYLFSDWEFVVSMLPNFGLGLLFIFLGASNTVKKNYEYAKRAESIKVEKIDLSE